MRVDGRVFLLWACILGCSSDCTERRARLISELTSPSAEVRAGALAELTKASRHQDLDLVFRMSKDPSPLVRAQVAVSLSRFTESESIDLLADLLADSSTDVQVAAVSSMGGKPGKKAQAYLFSRYARANFPTRHAIVQALAHAGVKRPMDQLVEAEATFLWNTQLKLFLTGSTAEQAAAAELLGKSGRPDAVDQLIRKSVTDQTPLLVGVIGGLGWAGDPRAVSPLLSLLPQVSADVQRVVVVALSALKADQALSSFRRLAIEGTSASTEAVRGITRLRPGPETTEALCEIVAQGKAPEVSAAGTFLRGRGECPLGGFEAALRQKGTALAALYALKALGPSAKPMASQVSRNLQSTEPGERLAAIETLGALEDPSFGPALMSIYREKAQKLVSSDREGLQGSPPSWPEAASGEPRIGQLLQKVRQRNIQQLKNLGKSVNVTGVEKDIPLTGPGALVAALLKAMTLLKVPGTSAELRKYVDHPLPELRAVALSGLSSTDGLGDSNPVVRCAVADVLSADGEHGQAAIAKNFNGLSGDRSCLFSALRRHSLSRAMVPVLLPLIQEQGAESIEALQTIVSLRPQDADPNLIRVLVGALGDSTGSGHAEVLAALTHFEAVVPVERLADELQHPDPRVRAAALQALRGIKIVPEQVKLQAAALKKDYFIQVRRLALSVTARDSMTR